MTVKVNGVNGLPPVFPSALFADVAAIAKEVSSFTIVDMAVDGFAEFDGIWTLPGKGLEIVTVKVSSPSTRVSPVT